MGVIAGAALRIFQRQDELMRFGLLGGGNHLILTRLGAAIKDVVAHRAVQQAAVLADHADMGAQTVLGHACDVLPVNRNAPRFRIVKPQHKFNQGRLARP